VPAVGGGQHDRCIAVFADNVFNKFYAVSVRSLPYGNLLVAGKPRVIGGEIGVTFQERTGRTS
jgi:hypothetical protein